MNLTARSFIAVSLAAASAFVPGCATPKAAPSAHLFDGMGTHTRTVTTSSAEAQRWFNQGLVWAYAFNHDEAIRSFEQAAAEDPNCAMAYWGIALCNGPHINNPVVPEERRAAAWDAVNKAQARAAGGTAVERDLISALTVRYSADVKADRAPMEVAYANAMRAVWENHPTDTDVGVLFAESMMDLRPWDLWTAAGEPQPGTEEIVATLEQVRRLDPDHPGANHLYIHTVEASTNPGRATEAADRLRAAVPAAGHLVHMPSHIDIRTGRYAMAATANERAIEADTEYQKNTSRPPEFYRVYMAHNRHFLVFTSMMEGREAAAKQAAAGMIGSIPAAWAEANAPMVDPIMGIQFDVLVRFGRWDEVLAHPRPAGRYPITTAMWRHARTVAFAAKGEVGNARGEHALYLACVAEIPEDAMMTINPAHKVLSIATHKSRGEIALADGDLDTAIAELRAAVKIEDTLVYMEPPDWTLPVRHPLGAVLMKAGRASDAEVVYREDLAEWPENGWSLTGLRESLEAQGRQADAAGVGRRADQAWARADRKVATSCLCVPALNAE